MELIDAYALADRLIKTQETHQDYERVTCLERDYRIYKTGENIGAKLVQFVVREDATMFAQRLRMTKSITPAITSSVERPFNKVSRNDRIRKALTLKEKSRVTIVEQMARRFYGAARKKNRGLDFWLKTRFVELSSIDPNAWIVVEWDAPENESDPIVPRPFEVSATQARNFYIENDEVHWLFVQQEIKFKTRQNTMIQDVPMRTEGIPVQDIPKITSGYLKVTAPIDVFEKTGKRCTLYDEDYTVVYHQIDKDVFVEDGGTIDETYQEIVKIGDDYFIRSWYEPKIGYVPAFRVGYKRDLVTDGRTFVNMWHDAMCYIEKTLKVVSEMDLTMSLHVFPQKLQYVHACQGVSKIKRCNGGYLNDGTMCTACNGNGYKLHTSAQDAILIPMPDQPTQADIVNLDNLLVYKAPPIETVKFQNEYIQQLQSEVHQAVYNSQVFVKKQGANPAAGAGGDIVQTATENDNNMQSAYDTLEPFTEKYSELYGDFMTTFAVMAGENVDDVEVVHIFPADYKLKSSDLLLSERKVATTSGAPSFILETIDDDLANIFYAGDQLGIEKYRTKRRYFPFTGKTPDEMTQAVASQFVPEEMKILFMNFEQIFKEIEREHPEFWVLKNTKEQDRIVQEKIDEFALKLKAANPTFDINQFREDAPGTGGNPEEENEDDPGDNPGSNNPNDPAEEETEEE